MTLSEKSLINCLCGLIDGFDFLNFQDVNFELPSPFSTGGQLPSSRHLALVLINNFTGAEISKF